MDSVVEKAVRDFRRIAPRERSYSLCNALANAFSKARKAAVASPNVRVAWLRNYTVEPLVPVLTAELVASGLLPEIFMGEFDASANHVLDYEGDFYSFNPDFIFLSLWLETLSPSLWRRFLSLSPQQVEDEKMRVRNEILTLVGAIRQKTGAPIFLTNFPLPPHSTLGILDAQSSTYHLSSVASLNADILRDVSTKGDVFVVDMARIFSRLGHAECFEEKHWHMARAPLSQKALVPVGQELTKYIKVLRGKSKKCLVLDCDNTLWGGIIGEDGIEGIKLGTTSPGSTFRAFQEEILNLHDRGVILALCSKNNEQDVLAVLREHPDMLIKEEHLAAWHINWNDKVSGLEAIAAQLNIGLDSLVFVDDSDFEVNLVRDKLPQVEVLQVKGSPLQVAAEIAQAGFFDSLSFTAEDRRKNAMYGEEARRRSLEQSSASLEDYLQKLEIEVEVYRASEFEIPRLSQLTQKTNQFNLTTKRYAEGQIRDLAVGHNSEVLCLKVRDRVADLGLVGLAIVRYEQDRAEIDSFLMSCRVIGRGVEDALLAQVIENASKRDIRTLQASYHPTAKNAQVKDFYRKRGFSVVEETASQSTYILEPGKCQVPSPAWITLRTGESHASK